MGKTTHGLIFSGAKDCGTEISAPGVWYRVVGTGDRLVVHTCGSGTTFDTRISVFEGNVCDIELSCVAGDDDSCGSGSRVSFDTQEGAAYYILVHAFGDEVGSFELSFFELSLHADDGSALAQSYPTNSPVSEDWNFPPVPTTAPTPTPTSSSLNDSSSAASSARISFALLIAFFACLW